MPKQRVKTEQEKEKKRRIILASVAAIVGRVGTQGETLGTVG
jgi:hypothetical protein